MSRTCTSRCLPELLRHPDGPNHECEVYSLSENISPSPYGISPRNSSTIRNGVMASSSCHSLQIDDLLSKHTNTNCVAFTNWFLISVIWMSYWKPLKKRNSSNQLPDSFLPGLWWVGLKILWLLSLCGSLVLGFCVCVCFWDRTSSTSWWSQIHSSFSAFCVLYYKPKSDCGLFLQHISTVNTWIWLNALSYHRPGINTP